MRQYEVTFIIDPVLSSDEINATAKGYEDHLRENKCDIVYVDEMGLRQLAYPINKRTSGIYHCIEFKSETHDIIERLELAFRRDERIMRFLTVTLDKYGVKYNEDKRNGLIGRKKKVKEEMNGQKETAKVGRAQSQQTRKEGSAEAATATAKAADAKSEEE